MINCNSLFKEFRENISIDMTTKKRLKEARDAIREKIKKYLVENLGKNMPLFHQQGSYALNTLIKPIDGEIDLDDGVYLQDFKTIHDAPTSETVHKWIINAIDEHTSLKPEDRQNCVRIKYAGDYHVDIPIYIIDSNNCYLARNGSDQWTISDPKKFKEWFYNQVKNQEQIRDLIIYLKAWTDFKDIKFPGFLISILVCKNYVGIPEDDLNSLLSTTRIICAKLKENSIFNPVNYEENLLDRFTETQLNNLIEHVEELIKNLEQVTKCQTIEKISKELRKIFGDRVPLKSDKPDSKYNEVTRISKPTNPWTNTIYNGYL